MHQDDKFYRQVQNVQKEQRRKERREKWAKREKKFWRAFLFTKDGKPKSGLIIYTFCLSFVFLAVELVAFNFLIEWLTPVTQGLPVTLSNLLQSLSASLVGIAVGVVLHLLLKDKRLVFGSYLWLGVYDVAAFVTILIMLRGTGAAGAFLHFYLWFMLLPVVLGLLVFYLLYRRDYVAPKSREEAPEWKKYVQRR